MSRIAEGRKKSPRERLRELVRTPQMLSQWSRARSALAAQPSEEPPKSLVILSADGRDPFGSRGDEAMIQAIIDEARRRTPGVRIGIATAGNDLPERIVAQGVEAVPVWRAPWNLGDIAKGLRAYDALLVIGADVLDGYYSSITSLRLWMVAEIFASAGGRAVIGGFSFNSSAAWPVRLFLKNKLSPSLAINLRDPVSLRRFDALSATPGRRVADCAFMLKPRESDAIAQTLAWVRAQRAEGRPVCGLNVHPMLVPNRDPEEIGRLVEAAATAARRLIDETGSSVVLLPHDFRGETHGDVALLARVLEAIDRPGHAFLQDKEISAGEIKAIAAELDMVFTGRMHLAIGSLGSGVPVVGITYQGKFAGLFEHFSLSEEQLIAPEEAKDAERLSRLVLDSFAKAPALRAQVAEALPQVKSASQSNLSTLWPVA
ncbi:hypothetical protein G5B46_23780 [Caulobacter sp. 602-2]|uniref:Polysaccharide pyruvyl transferase domain-containing protein n=1 Tax=Caulobacter sp. 602-2 TaxID=2710887 RepID=A0A6G4R4B9_9CAUL|nr:polysaccharide pyruvyl transferase family protein [Caulobacter sp. 602-2]NGM52642.1 hypothetical protein [Caulobacter sp. 602-2]